MKVRTRQSTRDPKGMAVIALIALIAIILIFVAGNLRTIHLLRSDVRLIERQQTNRLAAAGIRTNAPASGSTSTNSAETHSRENP